MDIAKPPSSASNRAHQAIPDGSNESSAENSADASPQTSDLHFVNLKTIEDAPSAQIPTRGHVEDNHESRVGEGTEEHHDTSDFAVRETYRSNIGSVVIIGQEPRAYQTSDEMEAHQRFKDLWMKCTESKDEKYECKSCKWVAAGSHDLVYLGVEPAGHTFDSADELNRYLAGPAHDVETNEFGLWAFHEAKIAHGPEGDYMNGIYVCPLEGCQAQTQFAGLSLFRAEVKSMHGAIYSSLCGMYGRVLQESICTC